MTNREQTRAKVRDLFVPNYLRGHEPLTVTIVGKLEEDTKVFSMSYPVFEAAIMALFEEVETEARVGELEWVADNLSDKDTDCGVDYMHENPADDGCDLEDHLKRDARFFYKMETEDMIQGRIKELQ